MLAGGDAGAGVDAGTNAYVAKAGAGEATTNRRRRVVGAAFTATVDHRQRPTRIPLLTHIPRASQAQLI